MKNKILELTKTLVRIKSVSSDLAELENIVSFVEDYFKKIKEDIENIYITRLSFNSKPSIIVSNCEGKDFDIILSGHLDVVPAQSESQFEPQELDGKLYGRGTGDMKSGDAIMMLLMKEILTHPIDKKIALILTTDEEVGGFDGVGALVDYGYRGDVVMIPDGGAINEVVIAQKGICMCSLKSYGESCHSSRPRSGKNALENLVLCVQDIKSNIQNTQLAYHSDNHRGTTVNCNNITTGTDVFNLIPDSASAKLDIRFTQDRSLDQVMQKVQEISETYSCTVEFPSSGHLLYTQEDHIVLKTHKGIVEMETGETVEFILEHGGSDGRFFAGKGSIIIIQRPTCENIHGKNERVEISDLEKIYNIYREFIKTFL